MQTAMHTCIWRGHRCEKLMHNDEAKHSCIPNHLPLQIVRAKAQAAIDHANREFQNAKTLLGSKLNLMAKVRWPHPMTPNAIARPDVDSTCV
eukprot:854415-Pelagomonas_calceolata.AAC.2